MHPGGGGSGRFVFFKGVINEQFDIGESMGSVDEIQRVADVGGSSIERIHKISSLNSIKSHWHEMHLRNFNGFSSSKCRMHLSIDAVVAHRM